MVFGRAQLNADQESYYWMDDNDDEEFYNMYRFIPDQMISIEAEISLQVSVRGLQWSNFLAQDVFFGFIILKMMERRLMIRQYLGSLLAHMWVLRHPEWNDDASFFNVRESITYTWDFNHYISPAANPQWLPDPDAV